MNYLLRDEQEQYVAFQGSPNLVEALTDVPIYWLIEVEINNTKQEPNI